jgi:hypothetical protein
MGQVVWWLRVPRHALWRAVIGTFIPWLAVSTRQAASRLPPRLAPMGPPYHTASSSARSRMNLHQPAQCPTGVKAVVARFGPKRCTSPPGARARSMVIVVVCEPL